MVASNPLKISVQVHSDYPQYNSQDIRDKSYPKNSFLAIKVENKIYFDISVNSTTFNCYIKSHKSPVNYFGDQYYFLKVTLNWLLFNLTFLKFA